MENKLKKLCELIEQMAGRRMNGPRDFEYLSMHIFNATHQMVSPSTLKRIWGYIPQKEDYTPHTATLNIMSQIVGYACWEKFQAEDNVDRIQSGFTNIEILYTKNLIVGTKIKLTWSPNRTVVIRHKGQNLFSVVESVNSKLAADDTFICPCFVQGEPLHLHCLVRKDKNPTNYVCGKENGVRFEIIAKKLGSNQEEEEKVFEKR